MSKRFFNRNFIGMITDTDYEKVGLKKRILFATQPICKSFQDGEALLERL